MTQNLPAYLQNKTSRGLAQTLVANLGVGSPPYLSIMGNRFNLIDAVGEEISVPTYDPKIGPYVDCVIIDVLERTSKIFYDKAFDPGAQQYEPPACFSDNGIGPSRNAAKPQSPTCASCPNFAWGSKVSAVSGKGIKACGDVQKIALLVPGHDMPFLLRVPPNSRTNFRGYVHKFAGQTIDVCDVLTRITFEQGQLGTLQFGAVSYVDEPTFAQANKLLAAKQTDALVGRTDLPREGALPPPAAAAQIAAPTQATQPSPLVAPTTQMPTQQQPTAPPVVGQAPATEPSQPQRRRRRTAAEMQAANAAPAVPPAQTQQPVPFQQPVAAPQPPPPNPVAQFGIAPGAAPNSALDATLNDLFGPPK